MQDRTLTCKDCGKDFIFPVSQQELFNDKGFNDPIRCRECIEKRKAEKNAMGGGRPGAGRGFGNDYGQPRPQHQIICKECGKEDTVNFKPKFPNDVLCVNCFRASKGQAPRTSFGSDNMSQPMNPVMPAMDSSMSMPEMPAADTDSADHDDFAAAA